MDYDDPNNPGDSPDYIDIDNENAQDDSSFEPLDFAHQNKEYQQSVSDAFALNIDIHDCWHIEDLYCDGLFYVEEDEQQPIELDDKHAILSWAAYKLSSSPTARLMLAEAEEEGWAVALESLDGPDFHIDVPEKLIVIDDQDLLTSALGRSEYFKNAVLSFFIRALRDVWQEKRHGAFDIDYGPEAVMNLERVRAADLDVVSILVGWELRGEGQPALWRHLIGAQDGDIAMRFSGYLERDPASLFNGKALAAAFSQWFRDEARVNACDHETLNYLDTIVQGGHASFGQKKLTPIGIEVLSCLPDKTAYLQGQGNEILRDPFYSGLGDPINQAHFMQILYDTKVVRVNDVPFSDADLAAKIFPNGEFTPEDKGTIH